MMRITPTTRPTNRPPVVGSVPVDGGTLFFAARAPAIAMAGMITSFNVLVLMVLNQHTVLRNVFRSRMFFWCWQGGTVVHAASMLAAGTLEAMFPSWLFTGHPAMNALYAVRLAAGLLMASASISWLVRSHITKKVTS